jgi:hypothetical protein
MGHHRPFCDHGYGFSVRSRRVSLSFLLSLVGEGKDHA